MCPPVNPMLYMLTFVLVPGCVPGKVTNPGGMEKGQHRRTHGSAHCFLHIRALFCRAMSRWSFFDHPIHARTIFGTIVNTEQHWPVRFANT